MEKNLEKIIFVERLIEVCHTDHMELDSSLVGYLCGETVFFLSFAA